MLFLHVEGHFGTMYVFHKCFKLLGTIKRYLPGKLSFSYVYQAFWGRSKVPSRKGTFKRLSGHDKKVPSKVRYLFHTLFKLFWVRFKGTFQGKVSFKNYSGTIKRVPSRVRYLFHTFIDISGDVKRYLPGEGTF